MDDRLEQFYDMMRKESNRLKTFQMNPPWPKDYVDIKKLAKAGFFYAFNDDNVHCAFCRGQVSRWDRDDDPMAEHARHFTTCPFIMGGEVGNEHIGDDPIPGPKRPRPYDVCGAYPNFPPGDPRHEHESSSRPNLSHGIQQQQQQQEFVDITPTSLQEHQQALTEPQNQNQPLAQGGHHTQQQPTQIPPIPVSDRYRDTYNQMQNYDHSIRQRLNNENTRIDTYRNATSDQSSNNDSGNWIGICKICYTNAIELIFLPCQHLVSCLSCAERLHDCPICREAITTRIRAYIT